MSYEYSGKVKCIDCSSNFRGKKQRDVRVYICSGYNSGKSECKRFAIREDELTGVVEKHRKIVEKDSNVHLIEVYNSEEGYVIKYDDGTHDSIMNKNHLKY